MKRALTQAALVYRQIGCPAPVVLVTIVIYLLVLLYCLLAVRSGHQPVVTVMTNGAVLLVVCACLVSLATILTHVRNWHRATVQVFMV